MSALIHITFDLCTFPWAGVGGLHDESMLSLSLAFLLQAVSD